MADANAGGFEYRGRRYRSDRAIFQHQPAGHVNTDASGRRYELHLVSVPFPGAATPAELAGRVWEPDGDELAVRADVFADERVSTRDKTLWVTGGKVACLRYDAERSVLAVQFCLGVQGDDYGREDELDGVAYCTPESPDEDD